MTTTPYRPFDCMLRDIPDNCIDGAMMIMNERVRQVMEEGHSAANDDRLVDQQLLQGADSYVTAHVLRDCDDAKRIGRILWPFDDGTSFKPTGDAIRDLTKAGAMIAAEIDRLLRMENYARLKG